MILKGKGINVQVLTECVCYLLFGWLLFHLTYTGRYLNYVTPRMKPYLYGLAALMLLWAVLHGRYILTPQYRVNLSRAFVYIIPILLIAVRPAVSGGSDMVREYDGSYESSAGETEYGGSYESSAGSGDSTVGTGGEESPWYDLNGLDEAAKTITIADEDYYVWMYELSSFYEKYEGYTVVMKGFVYRGPDIRKDCDFALVRLSMWCCAADLSPMGFLVYDDGEVKAEDDEWVTVKGTLGMTEDGSTITLKAQSIEAAEKPEEEYVYPYF